MRDAIRGSLLSSRLGPVLILLCNVMSASSGCASASDAMTGVIPAGWPTDAPAPVAVPILESWKPRLAVDRPARVRITLPARPAEMSVPAQFEPADQAAGTPDRLWFLFQAERDDEGRPISLTLAPPVAVDASYRSTHEAPRLEIRTPAGEPVLGYHHGKPIVERNYPLNDFIHPLIGLDGEVLTARSPGDHIHHRAIFWAWVRQEIDGEAIGDWWHPTNIRADARDLHHHDGPIFSSFAARHDWIHAPKGGATETPFVAEHVVCRVFQTTPQGRAVDVDISLRGIVPDVRFGGTLEKDKGYGGMTIRFAAVDNPLIESDGRVVKEQSLNHLRASWVDWTGHFHDTDGKPAPRRSGAALFVGADHPDAPPEWITRYYGPINVSWPGMNMVALPTDKPVHLRYRIWIHRGDANGGRVEMQYQVYVADWRWPGANDE
jgi:hypothetical protein